jgi:mersacidin/lichenicidin family type 2 lantibiotic
MTVDIARAGKDPEYRKTLTPEELASLPPKPAADPELTAKELNGVAGGKVPMHDISITKGTDKPSPGF